MKLIDADHEDLILIAMFLFNVLFLCLLSSLFRNTGKNPIELTLS